jgi:hypothetical protein
MVKLSLVSPKGNQGVRYFPYQGCLGLTPLRFEGRAYSFLHSSLPFRSYHPSSQSYAPRSSQTVNPSLQRTSSSQYVAMSRVTVAWERSKQMFSSSTRSPFGRSRTLRCGPRSGIPNIRFAFLSLPISPHLAPHSTFKNIAYFGVSRQASTSRYYLHLCSDHPSVLNHIPISAVGSRQIKHFELPLVRYDTPASLSPPTPLTPSSSSLLRSKSHGPPLRYHILVPPNPIGPLDIVSVQLVVQPLDSSVSIRSASAFVERRIHFNDFRVSPPESCRLSSYPPPNPQSASDHAQDSSSSTYPGSNGSSSQDLLNPSLSSVYSGDSSRPLLQHQEYNTDESVPLPSGGRGTTHIVAHAESAGRFSRDSSEVWRHNLTFSWPDTKSNSRWAVGESVQTGLASVKFFLRVKVRIIVHFTPYILNHP